ncbi:MAG: hypothetical protein M1817_001711 [Caeruleum heppii]|nr:MAG: hypothetical protein M1817_001711 [Caeruleum heppii]
MSSHPYPPPSPTTFYDPSTPPPPPPKPPAHSGNSTPLPSAGPPVPPPPPSATSRASHQDQAGQEQERRWQPGLDEGQRRDPRVGEPNEPDPGGAWVPDTIKNKSKPDLSHLLATPALLTALTNSPTHAASSTSALDAQLSHSLNQNITLARSLLTLEAELTDLRASTSARLLHLRALERSWRQKQVEMDEALAPFSPKALYQRLALAVQEQERVTEALDESFLDGGAGTELDRGSGKAGEREVADFVRRYREARRIYYLRRERKERWDEGRVGGWR